jgi:hypothetical protein
MEWVKEAVYCRRWRKLFDALGGGCGKASS